jgi:tetratricopeptide (TPR) repeat protein
VAPTDAELDDATEVGTQPPAPSELGDATASDSGSPRGELGLQDTIGTLPTRAAPTALPGVGECIDHFEVLGTLGTGGMGVVLRARDQLLDREVALKLVRPDLSQGGETLGQTEQLLAEARAMAKISHPNVIVVHEVGLVRGQVFLAMELIVGRTLAAWLREQPRSWRAIVDTWLAAARGLHAAHVAGLVHRDFKPANVLVDRDARVRVMDFGIAGRPHELADEQHSGRLIGTPRYMAPEQLRGEPADARSDQFAFCVSLWEALYGQHPFDATNVASLALSVSEGRLREPPRDREVPRAIRRLLARGLARVPAQRHADMAALIDALVQVRRSLDRRPLWIGLGIAAPLVAGLVSWAWPDPREPPDPCAVQADAWAGVWDDARRGQVAAHFEAASLPYVRDSGEQLVRELDAYVGALDAHQLAACRDTRVHGTVSEQLLDRRTSCLDRARRRVEALARLLGEGDGAVLGQALELVARLPVLDDCDDLARLEAGIAPPPPATRARLDEFERALARAETLDLAGRNAEAEALLEPWIDELARLEHPSSEARLYLELGGAAGLRDRPRAVERLHVALARAIESGVAELVAAATIALAQWDSGPDDAARRELWLSLAEASYARLGREPDYGLHAARSLVAREARDWPAARAAAERAMAAVASEGGYALIQAEGLLGSVCGESRDFECGRLHLGRAIELAGAHFGPTHRVTLRWRANLLGIDAISGRDYAAVVTAAEQLLREQEAGLGPDHAELATTLTMLGMALRQLDQPARAREVDARALDIRMRVFGPSHRVTIESIEKLGRDEIQLAAEQTAALRERGKPLDPALFEPGLARMREVIAQRTTLHGADHHDVGRSWSDLAGALDEAERFAEAVAAQREALRIMTLTLQPPHHALMSAEAMLGESLLELDQLDEAIESLERARAQVDAVAADPRTHAGILHLLAKAYRRRDPRDARAWRELAEQAIALLDAADDDTAPVRETLRELLAEP